MFGDRSVKILGLSPSSVCTIQSSCLFVLFLKNERERKWRVWGRRNGSVRKVLVLTSDPQHPHKKQAIMACASNAGDVETGESLVHIAV